MRARALVLGLGFAPAFAFAAGTSFEHKDWQLVCDNTRTCRAAGYQSADDADALPVSVLVTREAGAGKAPRVQAMLGTERDDQPLPRQAVLRIDGRALGPVVFESKSNAATLSAAQASELLNALQRTSRVEFLAGKAAWKLSGAGAAAVLLKMDEAQGRIGTVGALIPKGSAAESAVLPPVPVPTVQAVALAAAQPGDAALAKAVRPQLKVGEMDECSELDEAKQPVAITRLGATKVLASAQCWTAAYNTGIGFWVVDDKPPYRAQLVTTDGSDHSDGTISSAQKGRGLGDCWSSDQWVWDGTRFQHTASGSTGLCRLVAAGGAWDLPTLVTRVLPPRKKQSRGQVK